MAREVIDWNLRLNSLRHLLLRRVSACGKSDGLFRADCRSPNSPVERTGARPYKSAAVAPDEARPPLTRQKIDRPEYVVNHSSANVPASEFPFASSPGAHTHTAISPGSTATIPPPTPLLAGSPTR